MFLLSVSKARTQAQRRARLPASLDGPRGEEVSVGARGVAEGGWWQGHDESVEVLSVVVLAVPQRSPWACPWQVLLLVRDAVVGEC